MKFKTIVSIIFIYSIINIINVIRSYKIKIIIYCYFIVPLLMKLGFKTLFCFTLKFKKVINLLLIVLYK